MLRFFGKFSGAIYRNKATKSKDLGRRLSNFLISAETGYRSATNHTPEAVAQSGCRIEQQAAQQPQHAHRQLLCNRGFYKPAPCAAGFRVLD